MSHKFQKQLFDQFDCACSALLLNCGQFGCCIANVAEHEYGIGDCRQWMTHLASARPDAVLRDLVIPGTHDSGTYSFPKSRPFSAVSRTQNCSLYEQLQRGVRYLDLRVAGKGDGVQDVYIFHGFMAGCAFTKALDDVCKFMEENPDEFVFLHVVHEYGQSFSPEQRIHCFDLLQTTFGDKLYRNKDFSKLITGTSLRDLGKSSTRCVVLLHNRILKDFTHNGVEYTEDYILETRGYFLSSRYMFDKWHNTRKVDKLLEWNVDEVQRHGSNRGKLLCNQVLLTPGVAGAGDVLELLIGKGSLRPISFASALYKRDVLDKYLRQHADKKWNILKLDFCDLIPAALSFLIALNFPTRLEILTAAVVAEGDPKSIDVTDKIQSYVKRESVLYLISVQDDLGLDFEQGTLTIAYRLGGSHHIFEVDFDEATEIVLGEYTHNEGAALVHVDQTNTRDVVSSSGERVYYGGQVLTRDEYSILPPKRGTAIGISGNGSAAEAKFTIL